MSGPASEASSIDVHALSQLVALVHRGLSSEDRAAFYRYSVIAVVTDYIPFFKREEIVVEGGLKNKYSY